MPSEMKTVVPSKLTLVVQPEVRMICRSWIIVYGCSACKKLLIDVALYINTCKYYAAVYRTCCQFIQPLNSPYMMKLQPDTSAIVFKRVALVGVDL